MKLHGSIFFNHTILPVENRILLPAPVDFDMGLQPSTEEVTTFRNAGEDLLSTCKSMADTTKVEGGGLGVFGGGVTTSGGEKPDISGSANPEFVVTKLVTLE